ncbi:MAG: hypothetical protein GXO36_07360, partial [Chloroflexi bacterium]|nr:hypothetical protein [Chloroflexota bacterium]
MKRWFTRNSKWWLDALAVVVLLAIGWRYAAPLPYVTDIILADETRYAAHGLIVRQTGKWPYRARSYALWYALLSWRTQDLMHLYDFNFQVLTVALPLALYAVLRAVGLPAAAAFVGSVVVLVSDLLIEAWPRVTTF